MGLSSTLLVPFGPALGRPHYSDCGGRDGLPSERRFVPRCYRCDCPLETPHSESHPACGNLHRSYLCRVSICAVLTWHSETPAQVGVRYFLCQRFLGFAPGCCQNRCGGDRNVRWRPRRLSFRFSGQHGDWQRPLGRFGGTSRFGKDPSRFCGGNRRVPALAFTLLVAGTEHDSGCMESLAKTHNVRGTRARRWSRSRHRRIQDRPGRSTGVS